MSDITLTSGIRQNLLSLQQTSAELTSTQEALATGNAVNSAADNPSAYFTSQNLTNNANSLSSLLDQIGQGLQTIDAANNGLTGITSLLQQALSTVQQAQSDSWTTAAVATGSANLAGPATTTGSVQFGLQDATAAGTASLATTLAAADVLTIGVGSSAYNVSLASGAAVSTILSAIDSASIGITATTNSSGALVLTAAPSIGSFSVAANAGLDLAGGTVSTSIDTSAATTLSAGVLSINVGNSSYAVSIAADSSLATIESDINTGLGGAVTASDDGAGHLKLTSSANNFTVDASALANNLGLTSSSSASLAVNLNNSASTTLAAGTLAIAVGASTYNVAISAGASLAQIESDINNTSGLGANGAVTATDDGKGHLVLTSNSDPTSFTVQDNATAEALGLTTAGSNTSPDGSSSTRGTLQSNFNGLLKQIDQMAADSGYNGVNLLGGDNLVIDFNSSGTSKLTISGVTFNSQGLNLSSISETTGSNSFQDDGVLSGLIQSLNNAISTVQSQTETFGTNSSTISTRQTFTTNMINTLQTGASNLVAADQNQESADLLTEQTQQQLEISALSIANQANQSVLKLFG